VSRASPCRGAARRCAAAFGLDSAPDLLIEWQLKATTRFLTHPA